MNKLGIFMNFWEKKWGADHKYYINKVADMGYDILEFQAQPLLDMTDAECKEIKKAADARGIDLSYSLGLNPKYDISSKDKQTRELGVKYLSDIVYKIAVMEGGFSQELRMQAGAFPTTSSTPRTKRKCSSAVLTLCKRL